MAELCKIMDDMVTLLPHAIHVDESMTLIGRESKDKLKIIINVWNSAPQAVVMAASLHFF